MVKRAKFSLTMCNLRSKQGILQKFIRKKFCCFKKYTYLCGDSSHHASQLAQRTRVGLLHFTIPSSTFLQMALGGIIIMQPHHLTINLKNYKKSLAVSIIQCIFATIIKESYMETKYKKIQVHTIDNKDIDKFFPAHSEIIMSPLPKGHVARLATIHKVKIQ